MYRSPVVKIELYYSLVIDLHDQLASHNEVPDGTEQSQLSWKDLGKSFVLQGVCVCVF